MVKGNRFQRSWSIHCGCFIHITKSQLSCASLWFIIATIVWALPLRPGLGTQLQGVYERWFCLGVSGCSKSTRTWLPAVTFQTTRLKDVKHPSFSKSRIALRATQWTAKLFTWEDQFKSRLLYLGLNPTCWVLRTLPFVGRGVCCSPSPAVYMAALGFRLHSCLRWIQVMHFLIASIVSQVCKPGAPLHYTITVV